MAGSDDLYDLLVIGGGINGAGIAADAAQRGLKVLLAEAGDLGGGTSSASSKLIHGGLRYLEHYEFRLVRESLREREVLLANAPHIIWPLRFLLPLVEGMRPALLMRAGLLLYDHLAARKRLATSQSVDLGNDASGRALREEFRRGFSYWDCWVDDARLVVLNAIAARNAGARVLTRTPVTSVALDGDVWRVTAGDRTFAARALVNAAGPSVAEVGKLIARTRNTPAPAIRLVKGSHIVVPRIAGAADAFTFQNFDGRVVFALPFQDAFTVIGTTEVAQTQSGPPQVSSDEEAYLLDVAQRYFRSPPRREDIVWRFAGVRPLVDDGEANASAVSRDYRLDLDAHPSPPVLHVIGGKITTYRKLAEAALDKLAPYLPPMHSGQTATTPLPGGDIGDRTFENWFEAFSASRTAIPRSSLHRLARRYGTRAAELVPEGATEIDLGPEIAAGLSEKELVFLKREEWAATAEDVLWRRTKAGLFVKPDQRAAAANDIQKYLDRA